MRNRTLKYDNNFHVNTFITNGKYNFAHWHDALEIVYVLNGEIDIRLGIGTHHLKEDDFAIVNPNELHKVNSVSDDVKVLFIQIDSRLCAKFCEDIYSEWIYCFSSTNEKELRDDLQSLRQYIAKIVWMTDNLDDGDEKDCKSVEYLLKQMVLVLLDNFNIAKVFARQKLNTEDLKNSEVITERYKRVFKHLTLNYMNKINLSDIAKQENISLQYLSADIKDKLGMSFQEILNVFRVEHSEKMLLSSNRNILEISLDCGFSDPKYLDKNFMKYYGMTPSKYRKLHRKTDEASKEIDVIRYDISNAYLMVDKYVGNLIKERAIKNQILKIDLEGKRKKFIHKWRNYINLGNPTDFLHYTYNDLMPKLQDDIGFDYIRLTQVFEQNSNIKQIHHSWRLLSELVELLYRSNTLPIIVLDFDRTEKEHLNMLKIFLNYSVKEYGLDVIGKWILQLPLTECNESSVTYKEIMKISSQIQIETYYTNEIEFNYLNDTIFMVPYVLHNALTNRKVLHQLQAFDNYSCDQKRYGNNYIFYGGNGLMASNGLKKASYYTFLFLSQLGDELISKGDDYIVTSRDGNIQILLYNYDEKSVLYSNTDYFKVYESKEVKLMLEQVNDSYKATRYKLNEKHGSIHYHWIAMGEPIFLSNQEIDVLDRFAGPSIEFDIIDSNNSELSVQLDAYSAELIILEKI